MAFTNILSVIQVPGGFAVAKDSIATGEIYDQKETAKNRVKEIRAERKAKREAAKPTKTA